jgi:hypothetical protein
MKSKKLSLRSKAIVCSIGHIVGGFAVFIYPGEDGVGRFHDLATLVLVFGPILYFSDMGLFDRETTD